MFSLHLCGVWIEWIFGILHMKYFYYNIYALEDFAEYLLREITKKDFDKHIL